MAPDLHRWGIDPGYYTANGAWREPPRSTVDAILRAMGAAAEGPPDAPVRVLRPGAELGGHWLVRLEDGGEVVVHDRLPDDLPLGYHHAVPADGTSDDAVGGGGELLLIVVPASCARPEGPLWGWAVQLYSAWSRRSWGMGDLGDLGQLAGWSEQHGARVLMLNPLHAALPDLPQEPSPYFASSRCFRNPLYLRIDDVPGARDLPEGEMLAAWGHRLSGGARIDRDAVWRLKLDALDSLWRRFLDRGGDPAFDRYRREEGTLLSDYATFCALTEVLGRPWPKWPDGVRRPDAPGVDAFARARADRVGFHAWLQWLLDGQLEAAARRGGATGLVQDLAIGSAPDGADAWLWQDSMALGMRVGAPPDEFNTLGQDWGLPPFDPWRLRAAGYEPFRRIVRAGMRHGRGLRVDHVMGLFRLFWMPENAEPGEGAYVRYPWADLLGILALESRRAGSYVVGEDLGTVEDLTRIELAAHGVLSYRLLWFEPHHPRNYPVDALAAVTTHDLPTVAGLWSGADLAAQQALGRAPNVEATVAIKTRLEGWLPNNGEASMPGVVEEVYGLLAEAPSRVIVATLEDALGVETRPNMPGTVDEWPNWSQPLPLPLEEIETDPRVLAVGSRLAARLPP